MGGGISMNFLNAGVPVTILEMKPEALDRGVATMRRNYEGQVKKGKLKADKYEQRMSLLKTTLNYDDLKHADMVIEAVFEEMGVKQKVFEQLDAVMKPGAILASNTSTLDVNKIAAFTKRPQDVIGMHFFSPANVMRLLEIVRGAKTSNEVLASVMKVSKAIRKVGVVAGVCDGFIGNRMMEEYLRQAYFLVDEGASPQQVDRALQDWGLAMGPFATMDMAGQDIGWAIRKRRAVETPDRVYSKWPDRLCEMGRYGQKTGAGVYRYEPGNRVPQPDPAVDEVIAAYRKEIGIAPRAVSDAEIVERCILALANEGARLLEEGIASRASDIDIVYLTGYGFPTYRGGPMFYADTLGLAEVVKIMQRHAAGYHGECWTPAPLLARLAAEGKRFNK
jgi:3-hydroxyacyl-CoA dehydrogenase